MLTAKRPQRQPVHLQVVRVPEKAELWLFVMATSPQSVAQLVAQKQTSAPLAQERGLRKIALQVRSRLTEAPVVLLIAVMFRTHQL